MPKRTDVDMAPIEGILDTMTDKHGQIDLRFDGVELRWKGTPLGLELNGSVALTVHLRNLTDEEKKAHVGKNLERIRGT
ncbi:MAG TPA: hypothetical protein VGP88_07250 [Thermoplasmata archaeon]|jgi:hypothetical protein|nr:hypothetical protein [Thermoplasmata archaeon]